jgi:hypothetical protein
VGLGVFGQHFQADVEGFEAFLRNVVRLDVVDRDLHVIETGAVEAADDFLIEEEAVGDHAGEATVVADAGDEIGQVGVEQGFAAAEGNDGGAEGGQKVDAALHFVGGDGFGEGVVFVAVGAGKIAAPGRDDMREDGVVLGRDAVGEHFVLAQLTLCGNQTAPDTCAESRGAGCRHSAESPLQHIWGGSYSGSRWAAVNSKAGRQMATYSAPSGLGVE